MQPHFFTMGLYSEDQIGTSEYLKRLLNTCPHFACGKTSVAGTRGLSKASGKAENKPLIPNPVAWALLRVVSIETQICTLFPMFLVPTAWFPDRMWFQSAALLHSRLGTFAARRSSGCGMWCEHHFSSAVLSAEIYGSKLPMQMSILNCWILLIWCRGN